MWSVSVKPSTLLKQTSQHDHRSPYNHPVDETERISVEPTTLVSPGVVSSTLPVSFSGEAVQFARSSSSNNVKTSVNSPRTPLVPFVASSAPRSAVHSSSAVPSAVAHCTYQPILPAALGTIKSAKKMPPPSSTNSSKVVQGKFTAHISSFAVPVLQPS